MTKATKTACRVMVAAMLLLPIQAVRADMIALDRALAGQSAHQAALAQLEAHGISTAAARERVAAMSGEEAAALARQIESLPAGGNAALAFLGIILFFAFMINKMLETGK
jgi:hypothetical protein